MTVKKLAYSAEQHLHASTGISFKRTHIYELLAASIGLNSYAAFGIDTVLMELQPNDRQLDSDGTLIKQRCIELGYRSDIATLATQALQAFLTKRRIGAVSISTLVRRLQDEWPYLDDEFGSILLDGLNVAASRGNALAHYALALNYAPKDDKQAGSAYWYAQGQKGRVLTGAEKEWAEAYASRLAYDEKYAHHLKEAGRLGHRDALIDLAEEFDDQSIFEHPHQDMDADPAALAAIAERMGRPTDAKVWLTRAAESGDTDAMLQLIEEYDRSDLQRCWMWAYLSRLLGEDLTKDAYYAINENGSEYDDDVGGSAYVAGRGGIHLEPLPPAQDDSARLAAMKLFEKIR